MSFFLKQQVVSNAAFDRDIYVVAAIFDANGIACLRVVSSSRRHNFSAPTWFFRPARADEIQAKCRISTAPASPVVQSSRDELAEAILLAEIEHRGLPQTQSAAEMQVNACRYYSMADAMIDAREGSV